MDDPFYLKLERLMLKNRAVHIGNKSHWVNLPELRAWAERKGYRVLTKYDDRYVRIY